MRQTYAVPPTFRLYRLVLVGLRARVCVCVFDKIILKNYNTLQADFTYYNNFFAISSTLAYII